MRLVATSLALCLALAVPAVANAGAQSEEHLSYAVRAGLTASISDSAAPGISFLSVEAKQAWITTQGEILSQWVADPAERERLLMSAHYEAVRAGLDPELVLGIIYVESRFRKYAISSAGARGYMQVMPFWLKALGRSEDNLFHLRTNLRYGCSILRHYLAIENGDLFLALGRYNGSRGLPDYPDLVFSAWKRFQIPTPAATAATVAQLQ